MDSRLFVAILGPLRAFAGEREIVLGPAKQRAVFAILALRANDVVSRDDLVDGLWGESPPATAVGSLHTYVSGLRRALSGAGQPLASSRTGYVLRLDPGRLDIRVVEQWMRQARGSRARQDHAAAAAAYAEALAHWRPGPALSGLPGPFVAGYQTRMSDLRLRVLLEHAEMRLELREPAIVVDQLRAHVYENPYHERLRALLMTALRQSSQTADALAQYHDLRTRLADDLGIDPSAELQALYGAILADKCATPAATTPAPHTAPAARRLQPARMSRSVIVV